MIISVNLREDVLRNLFFAFVDTTFYVLFLRIVSSMYSVFNYVYVIAVISYFVFALVRNLLEIKLSDYDPIKAKEVINFDHNN